MPKRTNDFQQLVHMIQSAFAPVGAKVTESAMVPGQGTMREIDVLIESEFVLYSIKIAVEAKDEGRPLEVGHIEQIIGKYLGTGSIPANKVVVVARHGFTKAARERAADANIDLFTLHAVTRSDWTNLVPQHLVIKIPPHIDGWEFVPPVPKEGNDDPITHARFVCQHCGKDKGSPRQWIEWFLRTQVLPNPDLLRQLDQQAKRRNGQIAGCVRYCQ
jgi:hypothetical protein